MQQATCVAVAISAIQVARKWTAPKRRHALDVFRSIGPAVEASTRVLPRIRPSSVRQAVVSFVRWRRRTDEEYSLI